MTPRQQLLYATTSHIGSPLQNAARGGNLTGIVMLDKTYQQLLLKDEDAKLFILNKLGKALLEAGKKGNLDCLKYLLEMCVRYSSLLVKGLNNEGLWQKKLDCEYDGLYLQKGDTPLLQLFSDVFFVLVHYKKAPALQTLIDFLCANLKTAEEFDQFKKDVNTLLQANETHCAFLDTDHVFTKQEIQEYAARFLKILDQQYNNKKSSTSSLTKHRATQSLFAHQLPLTNKEEEESERLLDEDIKTQPGKIENSLESNESGEVSDDEGSEGLEGKSLNSAFWRHAVDEPDNDKQPLLTVE